MFTAAFGGGDPCAIGPRRVVANVLLVTAFEFGDPVVVLILVEADDFARGSGPGLMHGSFIRAASGRRCRW